MKIPKKDKEKLLEEVKKLKFMNPMSSESGVIRTYIEWVMSLPFGKHKKLNFDLKKAIQTLDDKHYGLEEIKDVILETIAVQKRVGISKKSILCFVGPPGVGKTSLGKSIATAMGRPFARIALGGLKDESEIRGHRRTYIGAMPGKIIQTMKKVKYSNPVILLDEIDKMSQDWRGDPASAMLEVLDPEQNKFFTDHYMEIEYDLSNVMFIATANSLDIPLPLADRMEIIHISGYTENEKLEIAQNYLAPDLMRDHGLEKSEISFSKNVLKHIIDYYTRESGVRELYRQILKICRKAVLKLSEKGTKAVDLDIKHIQQYLGIKKFKHNEKMQNNTIGVATGLAWTSVGGDILYIESVLTQGKGDIHITGKLGDVMQESAKAAFSYVKAHCKELGIDEDILKKNDIHVHVPEGAVSKNGPSAGITICTSIVSLLTNRPIKSNIAMTGEVTLVGNVLPIGGLKEKLIAADRSGITDILIPYENEKDLAKVPKEIKDKLNIKLVKKVDEVFKSAIENEVRH